MTPIAAKPMKVLLAPDELPLDAVAVDDEEASSDVEEGRADLDSKVPKACGGLTSTALSLGAACELVVLEPVSSSMD